MEVVKDLTCPICLEFYTHPIILPCSHVLCRRPCAENIFEINFIRCPVCRDNCYISGGISSLPRVITIESIIEKIRAERKKRAVANKARGETDSISDVTNQDTSTEEILADIKPNRRSHNLSPPVRSPSISSSSSRCVDQSSSMSTPRSYVSSTSSVSIQPHRLLQLLNLQLSTTSPHNMAVSSSPPTSTETNCFESSIPPVSATDREIQNILCSNNRIAMPEQPSSRVTENHEPSREVTGQPVASDHGHTSQNAQYNSTYSAGQSLSSNNTMLQTLPVSAMADSCLVGATQRVTMSNGTQPFVAGTTASPNAIIIQDPGLSRVCAQRDNGNENQVVSLKHEIQEQLQKLCDVQCQLLVYLTSYKDKVDDLQDHLEKRRSEVNVECDSLVAEVENKRNNFLDDIDEESKHSQMEMDDVTVATEKLLTSTQQLACFAEQILDAREEVLIEAAPNVLDRLSSSVKECELCLLTSEPHVRSLLGCHIDLRHERSQLREIDYLRVPSKPVFDVESCTRNNNTVVLVLAPPTSQEVIDSYEILYCSEEQKRLGFEERYYARIPESTTSFSTRRSSPRFIIIENLCSTTHYYFSACAMNREGRSLKSDHVQCVTLGQHECVVPVPTVMENVCHASSDNVLICCPSPTNVTAHQGVTHYMLYRQEGGAYLWQGEELHVEEEHRVQKLRPETDYQFIVLACNSRGECQLSEKISLRTCVDR